MIVVPFLPVHLDTINLIEEMEVLRKFLKDSDYSDMLSNGDAYTVLHDGIVISCGGVRDLGFGRYEAWSLMGKESDIHMFGITKSVRKFFNEKNFNRVEVYVKDGFVEAFRWAKMLGFKCETPKGMQNWGFDGGKYYLYSRIGGKE